MGTPIKRAPDSPSRQLLYELNQLAICSQEGFYAHLDKESEEREDLHRQALAAAALKHERVRKNAELEQQKLEAEEEAKRRKQEDESRRALERQRHENLLAERQREVACAKLAEEQAAELERLKRLEEEAARKRKIQRERTEEEAAQRRQNELEEQRRRQQQEADERAEAAAKLAEASVQRVERQVKTAPKPQPAPQPASSTTQARALARNPEWEAEHEQYLNIHSRLKELRKFVNSEAKKQPALKTVIGDMRRSIKKSVGQMTGDNRKKPVRTFCHTQLLGLLPLPRF